jgi:hypothetical protein
MRYLASDFFHESTLYGFLIHTLNLGYCDFETVFENLLEYDSGVHIKDIRQKTVHR